MFKKVFIAVVASNVLLSGAQAETVDVNAELGRLLASHALVIQASQELVSAEQQLKAASSGWFPTLSVDGEYGREETNRDNSSSETKLTTSQADLSLTQTLWDFGKTSSIVNKAEKQVKIKQAEHALQSQNLLLAGLEAYINLQKRYRVANFAQQSEDNIKAQTQLEDTRTQKGKGYTIDVLQAKAQLAGARATRVAANQALSTAKHRYAAVFNTAAPTEEDMPALALPSELLPSSEEELMGYLALNNPDLRRDRASVEEANAERQRVSAAQWMPSLTLVASANNHRNQDGTEGRRDSREVAVQFNWDINLAGQASHQVRAAAADEAATQLQADYTLLTVTETARNAWTDLEHAKERTFFLRDQADIAEQFLILARKERELGRRSLVDVLSGETALINAQSDYSEAQADVVIASYNILRTMGKLTLSNLNGL